MELTMWMVYFEADAERREEAQTRHAENRRIVGE